MTAGMRGRRRSAGLGAVLAMAVLGLLALVVSGCGLTGGTGTGATSLPMAVVLTAVARSPRMSSLTSAAPALVGLPGRASTT